MIICIYAYYYIIYYIYILLYTYSIFWSFVSFFYLSACLSIRQLIDAIHYTKAQRMNRAPARIGATWPLLPEDSETSLSAVMGIFYGGMSVKIHVWIEQNPGSS